MSRWLSSAPNSAPRFKTYPRQEDLAFEQPGRGQVWRIDPKADYGSLNAIARHQIKPRRIVPHWDDMLRIGGSLKMGRVPATGIMRTLQVGDRQTALANAIAEFGRIDKTLHVTAAEQTSLSHFS